MSNNPNMSKDKNSNNPNKSNYNLNGITNSEISSTFNDPKTPKFAISSVTGFFVLIILIIAICWGYLYIKEYINNDYKFVSGYRAKMT